MKRRLTLLTEIIAPYRIPVFNALASQEDLALHVVFLAETDLGMRQWHVYKNEIEFSHEVLPSQRWAFGKRRVLINRGVGEALSRSSPDAVLCGGYNYLASWQALHWARFRKTPFLIWIESTAGDQRSGAPLVESLKRYFVRGCSGAVVPGKSSFQYAQSLGFETSKIFYAPNAVDNDLFASRARAARENISSRSSKQLPSRYFLFTGRLVKEKGIFDLLEAYGKLSMQARKAIGLVFVGDGPERAALMRAATQIRGANIQFHGFVHREELGFYYGLADAFILPTHTDTWGLVVNEAMACQLPIILSSVAGCAADLVTDGWNGRVIQPRDVPSLAAAMQELAESSQQRDIMGQRSGERILKYSPPVCASGIANAVLSLNLPHA